MDSRRFRNALGQFPTGVVVATARTTAGELVGMTMSSFNSVSLDPPLILWSIRDDARSADAFIAGRHFILSVFAASQRQLALHFARPAADKFADWNDDFDTGIGGCPRLRGGVATFECTVYSRHQEGDHTILLGRVERHERSDAAPLLLHMGQMGSLWDLARASS